MISLHRQVFGPLTKLQCCPTSDGGAAALVCSEAFLNQHQHLKETAVEVLAMEMATDVNSFDDQPTMCKIVGSGESILCECVFFLGRSLVNRHRTLPVKKGGGSLNMYVMLKRGY